MALPAIFGSFFGGMGGGSAAAGTTASSTATSSFMSKGAMGGSVKQAGGVAGGRGPSGGFVSGMWSKVKNFDMLTAAQSISTGLETHNRLKNQGRLLHTQTQFKQRASRASQRDIVGKQVTGTAKSGLRQEGSTLDLINQTNLEFELDQAIMQHSYELQRDAMDRAGDAARISGFQKAADPMNLFPTK